MGKSPDISAFERGMIVGARRAGCSISETVSLFGLSKTTVSRVYREWCEKQKTSSHRWSCGRKRLVDEKGERRMERVVEANSQATCTQIRALYNNNNNNNNNAERLRPISLTTTRRTLKRLGYSCKAPRRDAMLRPDSPEHGPRGQAGDRDSEDRPGPACFDSPGEDLN
ncbi:hypothetical protein LDENG_00181680 [Lucifuga dentata]|nr:hypothetical protein LDENG_00181680 [Lucifuga dentata]